MQGPDPGSLPKGTSDFALVMYVRACNLLRPPPPPLNENPASAPETDSIINANSPHSLFLFILYLLL